MSWTDKVLKMGAESKQAFRLRLDSWANALTGLNTGLDKSTSMLPTIDSLLTTQVLEALFHNDDIAARIVSAVPEDAFRMPWQVINKETLETDADLHTKAAELENDLDALGARQKFKEAAIWGRLYGLGAILIGANDGQDPQLPLDEEAVTEIEYLTVLDKRDLIPYSWYTDPTAPKFGEVAQYQVQPIGVYMGSSYGEPGTNPIILVHESRLIIFHGELTSKRERLRNQGSDFSVLQKCFRALQLTNNNWQSASALLSDASQGVFKIKGLIDMIAQEPTVMQARMQLVDQMRSVVRALVLDTEEEFERVPTPFSGIPDLLEQTWNRLACAAKMPLTILMGTSPAGLNATGASDMRWWYASVAAWQRDEVLPPLERLLNMLAKTKGSKGLWSAQFPPLWQATEKEEAEKRYTQSQSDQIYLQEGVITPEQCALSRFGGHRWSGETNVDVTALLKMQKMRASAQKTPPDPNTLLDKNKQQEQKQLAAGAANKAAPKAKPKAEK